MNEVLQYAQDSLLQIELLLHFTKLFYYSTACIIGNLRQEISNGHSLLYGTAVPIYIYMYILVSRDVLLM